MKWRYSLRWKLPSPCPGPHELASEVVEAGQPAPESIMSRWVAVRSRQAVAGCLREVHYWRLQARSDGGSARWV